MILAFVLSFAARATELHVVRAGESVATVAAAAGTEPAAIRAANGLDDGEEPPAGTILVLPGREGVWEEPSCLCALSGTGSATLPGGASVPLQVGMRLSEGTRVCTDARSFASVRLAVGRDRTGYDDVNLLPETCITVDAAGERGGARGSVVSVDRGAVSIGAGEAGPKGTVTVRTPSGVTTGDGGGFRVTVEEGAARTEALDNPVAVFGAGVEVAVRANQGTRVRTGQAPEPPVDLLAPGTPVAPADGAMLRRDSFAWVDVPGALGFRVELATDRAFRDVVFLEEVDAPSWEPDVLLLPYRVPRLYWRVASFDRFGFLGRWSTPRRLEFPAGVGP